MKISIVTIVYNSVLYIEKTILSVINQTYPNIEYIIIDGGSTDGTLEIIKKYSNRINLLISEKDNGIYDAMNKGIVHASGEWINFMNSGDSFYNNNVIDSVVKYLQNSNCEILYGDVNKIFEWGETIVKPYDLKYLKNHMIFSHQSCFVKTELAKHYPFGNKYKIAEDYNFFYNQYIKNTNFLYIPICISNFDCINGLSTKMMLYAMKEDALINGSINKINWNLNYLAFYIKIKIRSFFKTILPHNIVIYIKRKLNKKVSNL